MYIVSVLTVGVICALADTMMPEGAVKRVGKLSCGIVLLFAVLEPMLEVDLTVMERIAETYFAGIHQKEAQLDQEIELQMKEIIEGECAAYIVDKAAQLGIICGAKVTCKRNEDGLFYPWEVRVAGAVTGHEEEKLSKIVECDLGVPKARQEYVREEAVS